MTPANFDFWAPNLNRGASSAGTSMPSESLNPTARSWGHQWCTSHSSRDHSRRTRMPSACSRSGRLSLRAGETALAAGSTVKTWLYLVLKEWASCARRPASAAATGDDTKPRGRRVAEGDPGVRGTLPSGTELPRARQPPHCSRDLFVGAWWTDPATAATLRDVELLPSAA